MVPKLIPKTGTRAAPNIPFRFDGFELLYSHLDWKATAFLTRPAKDSGAFDGDDHSTAFWGVYGTGWLAASRALGVDLYYLGIRRKNGKYASGSGDEHRHSFGAREFGHWQNWDWDAEEVLQFGRFHGDPILAWTASLDADTPGSRSGNRGSARSSTRRAAIVMRKTIASELSTPSSSSRATSTMRA